MSIVAVRHSPRLTRYPEHPPFSPSEGYPEHRGAVDPDRPNPVYDAVRLLLRDLGYDRERFGRPDWNPLGQLVRPGMTVVVKPNFVIHRHRKGQTMSSVITHASVIRAVVDYVMIALEGRGRVVLGDAPLQSCDFGTIRELCSLDELQAYYRAQGGVQLEVEDFRREVTVRDAGNLVLGRVLREEPTYRVVDLGAKSMLRDISAGHKNYRVTNYDVTVMARHHDETTNQYFIAQSVLDADVVITLPKLKTHRKTGLTAALKNAVGINCNKDCLPHHRFGAAEDGSDEYKHRNLLKSMATRLIERQDVSDSYVAQKALGYPIKALLVANAFVQKDPYREGSWYGNDTLWRTVHDLNRLLLFAGKDGTIHEAPQRRLLHIVDAIIGGDEDGPIEPTPREGGLLVAGEEAPLVDFVSAHLIGFDPMRIPMIANAFRASRLPLSTTGPDGAAVVFNGSDATLDDAIAAVDLRYRPSSGWKGHIERQASVAASA